MSISPLGVKMIGSKPCRRPKDSKMAMFNPKQLVSHTEEVFKVIRRFTLSIRNWRGLIHALHNTPYGKSKFEGLKMDDGLVERIKNLRSDAVRDAVTALAGVLYVNDLPNLPDEVLAGLIQLGYLRNEAFEELFVWRWQWAGRPQKGEKLKNGPLVQYYTAHIRTVRYQDAEDVLNDLYVKFLQDGGIETYDPAESFKYWFWKVAYCHMIDQMRRAKLRFVLPITGVDPMANGLGPMDQAILDEQHRQFLKHLDALPPDQQELKELIKQRMNGMSFEEIGESKGITKSDPNYTDKMQKQVYQPFNRAMSKLKKILT